MEEEIIETIEEETFDYSKLRYILKDGYVCHASLGASIVCDLGECTEYNGDIPDGYETIVEWYDEEIDKLNAWKVVNGNLVFDEQKYEELQTKCKLEEELNSCASKKYVNDKLSKSTTIFDDNMCSISNDLHILNSNESEIPEIIIEGTGDIKTNNDGYIEDARSVPVKSDFIYGMSIQEISTQSANIFSMSDKTFASKSANISEYTLDGYNKITIKGTGGATYQALRFRIPSSLLEVGATYYLGGIVESFSSSSTYMQIGINEVNISTGVRNSYKEVTFYANELNVNKSIGITIKDLNTYQYDIRLYMTTYTAGTTDDICEVVYKNLYLSTKDEYVDFIPNSPSPDYPSEIINNRGIENLFDYENTSNYKPYTGSILKIDNGIRIQQGVSGTYKFCCYLVDVKNLLGKTLTLSCDYKANASNNPRTAIYWNVNTDSKYQIAILTGNGGTFTIPKEAQADQIMILFYSNFNGTGNAGDYIDYTNIMLCEGTFKEHYLPYGSNYLIQKICGKNKFNKNDVLNNIVINTSGGEQSANNYTTSNYINCLPNTNYAISLNYVSGGDAVMRIACYDKNKNFISRIDNSSTKNYIQKTPSDCYYIRLSFQTSAFNDIQLEQNDKVTEYEPYKETLITYDLQGNELCEINGVRDGIDFISGVLTKRIDKYVITGNENWIRSGNTNTTTFVGAMSGNLPFKTKQNVALSNYFVRITGNFSVGEYSIYNPSSNGDFAAFALGLDINEVSDIATFKTWLQNQYNNGTPVIVYYILSEPQTIQLEPTEIITYEGINNIYTESNVDVEEVDITYAAQKTTFLDGLKVHISNDNILPIETINQSLNGLDMAINEDKSISLNGTTKNDTEFILNGSIDNIDPIFMLSKFNDFIVSGLTDDVKLNLYSNDGTNRELVYSGSNGDLRFDDSKIITCATLSVVSGKTLKIKIKPMITLDYIDYVEGKRNDLIDIPITELNHNEYLKIDRDYVKLCDSEDETELKVINTLKSFNPNTLIQLNDDRLKLATRYFTNQYINERLAKIEVEQDGITSKVSAMYDFTKEVKGNNSIILEDVQLNGLLKIVLKGNIIPPFPSENLFPSTNLYPVSTGLIFDTEEGTIRVNLPIDYLAELDGICDEFVWEMIYDNENKKYIPSTKIIRRIDLIDGVKTIRDEEEIIDLGLFEINIPEGTTKVYVEQYEEIEMFIRYSMINAVLAPYSTKAETETKIEQTATAITQEANAKIEGVDKELNAKLEVKVNTKDLISEINASADVINLTSDRLIIDSTNFKLDRTGLATMKDVYIDGGDISMKGQGESKVTIVDELVNYKTTLAGSSLKVQVGQEFNSTDYSFIEPGVVDICSDNYRMMMASATIYTFANNNRTISINGSSGDINAVGNITGANISSDRRLKENIKDSELNALNVINNIKVKSFDWKDKNKKHVEAGFIAQEVEKIDENFVIKAEVENKDNETIDYQYYINVLPIVATLTKAMQEQQKIIEDLQKEIKELKSSFLVKGDEE